MTMKYEVGWISSRRLLRRWILMNIGPLSLPKDVGVGEQQERCRWWWIVDEHRQGGRDRKSINQCDTRWCVEIGSCIVEGRIFKAVRPLEKDRTKKSGNEYITCGWTVCHGWPWSALVEVILAIAEGRVLDGFRCRKMEANENDGAEKTA